jgi:hypothetical protein
MPGVFRPYTLVDILGTLNDQSSGQQGSDQIISGLGFFAETDESAQTSDSMTGTLIVGNSAWDAGAWGSTTWG